MRWITVSLWGKSEMTKRIVRRTQKTALTWSLPKTLMSTPPSNIGCESTAVIIRLIFWKVRLYKEEIDENITSKTKNWFLPATFLRFSARLVSAVLQMSWRTIHSARLKQNKWSFEENWMSVAKGCTGQLKEFSENYKLFSDKNWI